MSLTFIKNKISKIKKISKIFIESATKREKRYFLLFLVFTLFSAFVEINQVINLITFIKLIGSAGQFDILFLNNLSEVTIKLMIFSLSVFISRSVLTFISGLLSAETSTRFTSRIFYYYAYEFFLKSKFLTNNDLIKSFSSSRIISQGIIRPGLEFFSSIVLSLTILLGLILKDPLVTSSIVLFVGILYLIIYKFSNSYATKYTNLIDSETSKQYENINKISNTLSILTIENTLSKILFQTSKSLKKSRTLESRCVNLSTIPKFFLEFLCIFAVSGFIVIFQIDKASTFNIIAFAFIASQKIVPLFQLAYRSLIDIKGNLYSLDLAILSKIDNNVDLNIGFVKQEKNKLKKRITKYYLNFKDVSYKFSNSKKFEKNKNNQAFELGPFDLKIDSRYSYAIIGKSGSGKTTFSELLLGLRIPDTGSIDFIFSESDRFERKKSQKVINVSLLKKEIFSYVPQKPYFFPGTILENLIYPRFLESESNEFINEDIFAALKIVEMEKIVAKLGLDHFIGDYGEGLSTGQLQRLGIARAIINNKRFIVLDECTSNLDEKTESLLFDKLNTLKNSCIIHITHKKTVYSKVDKIIKIVNNIPVIIDAY